MHRLTPYIALFAIAFGIWQFFWPTHPAVNPDPNHNHADFAVWVGSTRIDFAKPEYMSGTSDESDPDHQKHDLYFHLHDGNGNVIHRHKPGLTLGEFFETLGMEMTAYCMKFNEQQWTCNEEEGGKWLMFVNGEEREFDRNYVFADTEQILLTYDDGSMPIRTQLRQLTTEACLYSKTCPWRGTPPAEGCVADPTVPCME